MAAGGTNPVVRHLHRVVLGHDGAGLSDGELLERFLTRHEQDAFAALVRRHGRMVLGVCRRVLRHDHDADDAFQATFLVLVRKAPTLCARQTVGDFLYGVAYHTALKARAAGRRRRDKERQAAESNSRLSDTDENLREALVLLDRELHHLPERYRVPVVLCDLEGMTHHEAARALGWPQGTVSGRLSRARDLLGRRLRHKGVAVALPTLLPLPPLSALPPALVHSTTHAAALAVGPAALTGVSAPVKALTEGVLHAMSLKQRRLVAAVVLAAALLSSGTAVVLHRADAQKPAVPAERKGPAAKGQEAAGELTGFVESVDAARNTLTLANKQTGAKTFAVAQDARVFLDDGSGGKLGFTEGKLADLTSGLTVTVRLARDGNTVLRVWAEGPVVRGVLKSVDAGKRTLTVTYTEKKGDAEREGTYEVAAEAPITIQAGKSKEKGAAPAVTLAELPAGAVVTLKLSADRKHVGSVQAEGPEIRGVVRSVDAAKNAVTVDVEEGGQTVQKTFTVPAHVSLWIDDGKERAKGDKSPERRLADLPAGAQVTLRLTPDRSAVMSLSAQGATVTGTVKSVEAATNSVTLAVAVRKGEPGEDRTLVLSKDAAVRIDGKDAKLADMPVDAVVTARLSLDQKFVTGLYAEGGSASGTVKSVDADQGTITLANKAGERTFSVGKAASISVDGRNGRLADVPVDSEVHVRLTANQRTVVALGCNGPSYQGVLKAVDPGKSTVTVSVAVSKNEFEDKVFDLAKDVRVVTAINQIPLGLADLKADKAVVLQMRADQKTVLRIAVVGE